MPPKKRKTKAHKPHKDHVPDFIQLMTDHIMGAATVLRGKINKKKSLVTAGLEALKHNTMEWGCGMAQVTGSPEKGHSFAQLWGRHVTLEGEYIGAVFACKCHTMDFGVCERAEAATEAVQHLKDNGRELVNFLTQEFGREEVWTNYWLAHLQCVKDFIDMAKLTACKVRTMKDFKDRVVHCIDIGKHLGNEFNSLRHPEHVMQR